jgi:5'-deoxynucleotidase
MSHLFAYLARMKFIRRWGLMHNNYPENVQEHSQRVAMIAHALAVIRNRIFGGEVDAERVAVLALYHDASEVFTGDLPTPVKYFSDDIRAAYRQIESRAERRLRDMVPAVLREDFGSFFESQPDDRDLWQLVRAADKLCAYIKCVEEVSAGNREFTSAERTLKTAVEQLGLPEVDYFVAEFLPSFRLTLDELGA